MCRPGDLFIFDITKSIYQIDFLVPFGPQTHPALRMPRKSATENLAILWESCGCASPLRGVNLGGIPEEMQHHKLIFLCAVYNRLY